MKIQVNYDRYWNSAYGSIVLQTGFYRCIFYIINNDIETVNALVMTWFHPQYHIALCVENVCHLLWILSLLLKRPYTDV